MVVTKFGLFSHNNPATDVNVLGVLVQQSVVDPLEEDFMADRCFFGCQIAKNGLDTSCEFRHWTASVEKGYMNRW